MARYANRGSTACCLIHVRPSNGASMKSEDNFKAEQKHKYLPDSLRGINESRVFVKFWTTPHIQSADDAMRLLISRSLNNPIHLREMRPDKPNLTVVVEASSDPRIHFGCSLPSDSPENDLGEIVAVLKANGLLETRIS